jgi:hypothetical protein
MWKTCGVKGEDFIYFCTIPHDDIVRNGIVAGCRYHSLLEVYSLIPMETPEPPDERAYGEDGVDLTMIRWMLSLSPAERLEVLQTAANGILEIRERNGRNGQT